MTLRKRTAVIGAMLVITGAYISPVLPQVGQAQVETQKETIPTPPVPVVNLPDETKKQLADIQSLLRSTHDAVQRGAVALRGVPDIQKTLHDIRNEVNPSLFTSVWHSFVGNVVWEFFGIKRDSKGGPTLAGRVVSLLGLVVVILKLIYWWKKTYGADASVLELAVAKIWPVYATFLVLSFFALSWSGVVTNLSPEAVAFNENVAKVSAQLQAIEALPDTLKSIDQRLSRIETQSKGPSVVSTLFRSMLWLVAMFLCVVGGIYFYAKYLADGD